MGRCAVEAAVSAAKAKVIPRVQAARLPLQLLLRRERSDDLLEARIASERIPPRHQFQFTIADVAGRPDGDGKLFAGEIFFSNPRCNHCEVSDQVPTDEGIFLHWQKLECAA